MADIFHAERIPSPLGEMLILTDSRGRLRIATWDAGPERTETLYRRLGPGADIVERPGATGLARSFEAYFNGDLAALDAIETAGAGTEFQTKVWTALRQIPCGETISYSELARRIGKPDAVRAVGLANGANPVAVVTPCHRVIGANGTLTGYGGGLNRKAWLLAHEGAHAAAPELLFE